MPDNQAPDFGCPDENLVALMHDLEPFGYLSVVICERLSAGISHAVSKELILYASIDNFLSDLGIVGIKYLVSVSAHPYLLNRANGVN